MNLLLFEQHELNGSILKLSDRRAAHIKDVLALCPGDCLRLGMINGSRGRGRVRRIEDGRVELKVEFSETSPAVPGTELVLALPRPIMLQRILKQATVLGVKRFHLIRSRRVEKSFFQTTLLQPQKLREILVQGLEQAMDTQLPEVFVHKRFRPFIEDVVPSLSLSCRLLAHPDAKAALPDLCVEKKNQAQCILAIGPEGGWSDYEIRSFQEQGFLGFSMGPRILHVDTAVVALLSQLQLLQALRNR